MKRYLSTFIAAALLTCSGQTYSPRVLVLNNYTQPEAQPVIGIIPGAIVIGGGIAIVGWGGLRAWQAILNIWERQVTNSVPHIEFTVATTDEYPE